MLIGGVLLRRLAQTDAGTDHGLHGRRRYLVVDETLRHHTRMLLVAGRIENGLAAVPWYLLGGFDLQRGHLYTPSQNYI